MCLYYLTVLLCFFFNDTATTEIYTLSLHDALPISGVHRLGDDALVLPDLHRPAVDADRLVRLRGRLGALVHDADGDAAAGQPDRVGQAEIGRELGWEKAIVPVVNDPLQKKVCNL